MTRLLLNIMINAEFVYKIFSVVTFSYNISQRKDYIPLHERKAFLQLTLSLRAPPLYLENYYR